MLRCLAIAMGLGEEFFTPLCDGNHQNLRLLHYPECPKKKISAGGQKRGGVHSDYGSITLLTQWQDRGGLASLVSIFVDLTEARSLSGITHAAAQALDLVAHGEDDESVLQAIGEAICQLGPALLIFDNFEQVVCYAADTVGRWRSQAPEATKSQLQPHRTYRHQDPATMAKANGKQNVWRTQALDHAPLRAPRAEVVLLAQPFQLTFTHRIVLVTCSEKVSQATDKEHLCCDY